MEKRFTLLARAVLIGVISSIVSSEVALAQTTSAGNPPVSSSKRRLEIPTNNNNGSISSTTSPALGAAVRSGAGSSKRRQEIPRYIINGVATTTKPAGVVRGATFVPAGTLGVNLGVTVPTIPSITNVTPGTEKVESIRSNNLETVKKKGQSLVQERVAELTSNARLISQAKGLTTEQKSVFSGNISTEIAGLNTLDAQIQAGEDVTSTKALASAVYADFRIYSIVIPKIRLEKRIYELQNHITKLTSETFVNVQTAIDTQKAIGVDTAVWQAGLDDAKALVLADATKLDALLVQISALKPSDYSVTGRATIDAVNLGVKSVARDLESVRLKVKGSASAQ